MAKKKLPTIYVHLAALIPFGLLIFDYATNNLTANPIQDITLRTGKTALVLLVLTLACTPLNILGFRQALRYRRLLGLYTFFYAFLHASIFFVLDYGLNWEFIKEGLFEKRYALVGLLTVLLMLPLAITSFGKWQKRLGKKWKRLHQLIYPIGILAVIHYIWLVKSDIREPLIYGGIVSLFLIIRIPMIRKRLKNQKLSFRLQPK